MIGAEPAGPAQVLEIMADDDVVPAEDPALRANRLALLAGLHAAMNRVADLSKLAV